MRMALDSQALNSQALFAEADLLRKDIVLLLRKGKQDDLRPKRARLCKLYEHLLLHEPELAANKKVGAALWRSGFHGLYTYYRGRKELKKSNRVMPGARRLRGELLSFLDAAKTFYERLFESLKRRIIATESQPDIQQLYRASLYRCCIVLGDLARYAELYREHGKKAFRASELWYHRALELVPSEGNAHNQLAVLALQSPDSELIAVYRYIRAFAVRHPFETAIGNLALLFDQNRKRVSAMNLIDEQDTLKPLSSFSSQGLLRSNDRRNLRRAFLARFVWLHGLLQRRRESNEEEDNYQRVPKLLHRLFAVELPHLLQAAAFGSELLLAMIVVSIHSINKTLRDVDKDAGLAADPKPAGNPSGHCRHDLAEREEMKADKQPSLPEDGRFSSWRHSLACSSGFGIGMALVHQATMAFQSAREAACEALRNGTPSKPVSLRSVASLVPASVFCEWLDRRADLLDPSCDRWNRADAAMGMRSRLPPARVFDIERSARKNFWHMLSGLLNGLRSVATEPLGGENPAGEEIRPLREECRLRGYLPLDDLYEPRCCVCAGSNPAPEDMRAYGRRIKKIMKFAEWVVSMGDSRPLRYDNHTMIFSIDKFSTETMHASSASAPAKVRRDPSRAREKVFEAPPPHTRDTNDDDDEIEMAYFDWAQDRPSTVCSGTNIVVGCNPERPPPISDLLPSPSATTKTAPFDTCASQSNAVKASASAGKRFSHNAAYENREECGIDERAAKMVSMIVDSPDYGDPPYQPSIQRHATEGHSPYDPCSSAKSGARPGSSASSDTCRIHAPDTSTCLWAAGPPPRPLELSIHFRQDHDHGEGVKFPETDFPVATHERASVGHQHQTAYPAHFVSPGKMSRSHCFGSGNTKNDSAGSIATSSALPLDLSSIPSGAQDHESVWFNAQA